ncbi:RNA chaperone Hfq [Rubellimicrobium aerolatum]|nr:RNA chaperone Hfq [Rubellimicrobium aerolatum]
MSNDEGQSPAPRRVLGLAATRAAATQGKPATVVAPVPSTGMESPAVSRHSEADGDGSPMQGRKNKTGAGMADSKQNLQDAFLNHVRKTKVPVTIFLINGVKLQGVITWFDSFCVLLRRDGQSQLVYKSAISTIMPAQPINLYDGDE